MSIHVTKAIQDAQIHVLLVRYKCTENFLAQLSCIADEARWHRWIETIRYIFRPCLRELIYFPMQEQQRIIRKKAVKFMCKLFSIYLCPEKYFYAYKLWPTNLKHLKLFDGNNLCSQNPHGNIWGFHRSVYSWGQVQIAVIHPELFLCQWSLPVTAVPCGWADNVPSHLSASDTLTLS